MTFTIWSGMLVFNIIVISVNIRVYLLCNQISLIMVISSFCSVLSYYLVFLLVEVILYSDVKNVLNHQLQSPIFWLLLLSSVFAIEGSEWCYQKLSTSVIRDDIEDDREHLA